jgi:hypothetical protein
MRKFNDSATVRQVLQASGYSPRLPFYSESRKTFRRVKAWGCPVEIKDFEKVTLLLKQAFGDRFIGCENHTSWSYHGISNSFVVKLTLFPTK